MRQVSSVLVLGGFALFARWRNFYANNSGVGPWRVTDRLIIWPLLATFTIASVGHPLSLRRRRGFHMGAWS